MDGVGGEREESTQKPLMGEVHVWMVSGTTQYR